MADIVSSDVASESFDAIVIGSGLGGLTAGALFSHAGYRVLVLERNHSFGGAATTYHRGRMTIEGSLHETPDPRVAPDFKAEVFEALGLYKGVEFVPVGELYELRGALVGEPLVVPDGFEAASARLVQRFPADAKAIEEFFDRIDKVRTAGNLFAEEHSGRWWLTHGVELPLVLWPVVRDLRSSVSTVLDRCFGSNEALKVAVAANVMYYTDDPDTMSWLVFAMVHGGYLAGGGNYLLGGSQTLSDCLVDRITAGGGEARARCEVTEVLLDESGSAVGVRYQPDDDDRPVSVSAPVVFANAAPHVVSSMLPPEVRSEFMAPYADRRVSISLFSISLGLDTAPSELGITSYSTVLLPDWVQRLSDFKQCAALLGDEPGQRMPVLSVCDRHQIESGLRSKGELYTLNIIGGDRLTNWERLSDDEYHARRDSWLAAMIAYLDSEWPGLQAAVRETDMATAKTMHRFLNTPDGAIAGFAPDVPDGIALGGPFDSLATSINGMWLASAFSGAGGFSGAIGGGTAAARAAIEQLHQ